MNKNKCVLILAITVLAAMPCWAQTYTPLTIQHAVTSDTANSLSGAGDIVSHNASEFAPSALTSTALQWAASTIPGITVTVSGTTLTISGMPTGIPAANLTGLAPVAISGNYSALQGAPTIPTNNNQLANGAGYITSGGTSAMTTGTLQIWQVTGTAVTVSGTQTLVNKTLVSPVITNPTGILSSDVGAVPTAAFYNSEARMDDMWVTEDTVHAADFYVTVSGSAASVQQVYNYARITIPATTATASGGVWTSLNLDQAATFPFTRYVGYFLVGNLWQCVGAAGTSPVRISVIGSEFDVQGAAPTAPRVDLVFNSGTTAHLECYSSALTTGTTFSIPTVMYSNDIVAIKIAVSSGTASAYIEPNSVGLLLPTSPQGTCGGAPASISPNRFFSGVHMAVTGTASAARVLDVERIGFRLVR